VSKGTAVARIYAVDAAEVRLPLSADQLAFVELPLDYRGEAREATRPEVVLRASLAGQTHEWRGRIERTEGEIDTRTRMLFAVARVEDPYARGAGESRPPLASGLFVEADILGRVATNVVVLPRTALRGADRVLVVNGEERLSFRDVTVLGGDRASVVIGSGLDSGERVCVSPLDVVVEGMRVRTGGAAPVGLPEASGEAGEGADRR
jgi:multidrug efflux pump subunit AcrA (membrane-fusion protein)